jgi:isopenicillin-N epimerase
MLGTVESKTSFGRAIRAQWTLEDGDFLNHGSFGATPIPVRLAQQAWRDRFDAQPVRFVMRELGPKMREVAAELGAFLHADPQNLVWMDNATTGIATVLAAQPASPGGEWLTTDHVYGAVRKAMQHLGRERGVQVIEAPVPFPIGSPDEVVAAVESRISDRTRLIVIDHVTSFSGLIFPVERIIEIARSRGIRVLVDGAHAPGMLPLDLAALAPDYYVGNCHKWLFSAKGCAFLYARPDPQPALRPLAISHFVDDGFTAAFDWTGTRDPSAWLSLPAALAFCRALPLDEMRSYNLDLLEVAAGMLSDRLGVAAPAPAEMRGFLATLPLPDGAVRRHLAADETLESRGVLDAVALRVHDHLWDTHRIEVPIMVWGNRLWFRISAQVYNTIDGYERLAGALR